ncbi:MAG: hypothetical protein P8080_03665 [Gammaproteobacteria bacterium]
MDGPKLVVRQHDPTRWRLAAAAAVILLLLLAFGLFELGRQAGGYSMLAAARESRELQDRITALEQENGNLKAEIARLETTLEVDLEAQRQLRSSLEETESQVAELNEELAFYRRIMAPSKGEGGLRIQGFEVAPAEAAGRYRVKLVLVQARQRDDRTSGELAVEIKGQRNGEDTRLSLQDLAADAQTFDFRYFQDIDFEVQLPQDFTPDSAQVVLTPRGRGEAPVSASFPWRPGD